MSTVGLLIELTYALIYFTKFEVAYTNNIDTIDDEPLCAVCEKEMQYRK